MTSTLGVDWACARCLLGIALSHTVVDATYGAGGQETGELESTVTGLYPYLGVQISERFSVWGLVGQGEGELIATPAVGQPRAGGLEVAPGRARRARRAHNRGQRVLAGGEDRRAVLAHEHREGRGNHRSGGRIPARAAGARRGVAGVGSARRASLRSSFVVAAREDAGDAENGLGVEVAGALKFTDLAPGLSLDVGARGLVSHESEDYREWGVSGGFRYDPKPESAAGPLVSRTHSWGPARSGGLQELLWRNDPLRSPGRSDAQLSVGLAWGFDAFGALGVPWARVGTTGTGKEYRVGYSLFTHMGNPSFEVGQSTLGLEYRMGWEFTFRCRMHRWPWKCCTPPAPSARTPARGSRSSSAPSAPGRGSCKTLQPLFATGAPR